MELTQELVRELLDYNPETGVMTWKERGREWFPNDLAFIMWNSRFPGNRAGSYSQRKKVAYRCRDLSVLGKSYREHRVVWIWMSGPPGDMEIDHINRDPTDNRWENLRLCDKSSNSRNRNRQTNNKSGVNGVRWCKQKRKWHAYCRVDGHLNHLGFFELMDDARVRVEKFRLDHGFSDGHGEEVAPYLLSQAPVEVAP